VAVPRRSPPPDAASIEGEVPFHDVDPLFVAWHGHYYKYMELARTALFRRHGIDGPDLIPLGFRMFLIESECRHVAPLRYGHRYRVSAWFIETAQRLEVAYDVMNLTDNKRAARGRTVLVTTDAEGNLLLETPRVLRDRIAAPVATSEP
jgi:acyl-CoA thioester hydrolase